MIDQTIGTCSLCGGEVRMPTSWGSIIPPRATCGSCGAVEAKGPVIPMTPRPGGEVVTGTHTFADRLKAGEVIAALGTGGEA